MGVAMRLMGRLVLAQLLPLGLVTAALATVLTLVVQLTTTLRELSAVELGTIDVEATLHRAGWGADVSMRRGLVACQQGLGEAAAVAIVRERTAPLRALLARDGAVDAANPTMVDIAHRYLRLLDELEPVSCARLADPAMQKRRSMLDEELTDAWVTRLKELNEAVKQKEAHAAALGARAVGVGTALSVLGLFAALAMARRLAAGIRRPLLNLERLASRFGDGDFSRSVEPEGPLELQQLAMALERMRRRLAEVDALKQGFLASVSHELRTPLSKIREALALLADGVAGPLTERQERVVRLGRDACEREIRLVTTLLDLSRLRAGTPLRPQAGTAIDAVVKAAIDDERDEAKARGVTLELQTAGDVGVGVYDAALCERAIANLVRNAVAVSQTGQRVLVTRTRHTTDWAGRVGAWVSVRVEDDGPGVPAAIRSVVFDPFVTAAVEQSPKSIGVGLGLALAREVARAHGGELLLDESEGPRGSAFSLWLPLTAGRAAPHVPASPATIATPEAPR
jgi:two-component system, NtrC family, sensor histidine kinase GlrK